MRSTKQSCEERLTLLYIVAVGEGKDAKEMRLSD